MKKVKFLVAVIALISFLSFSPVFQDARGVDYVSGATSTTDETLNFEYVKSNGEVQTFTSGKGGTFKVYTATLSVDPSNNVKKVALYGKLDFPLNSTEFGADEFESKLYLTKEESFVMYNGGIKSYLIWSEEDHNSKYDKQLFMHDGVMQVRGNTLTLTLGEEEFEIKVPEKSKKVDTTYLEEAINEHWNAYNAVKNSGLKLVALTEDAYIAKNTEARALVEKASLPNSSVTDEELESMRKELNEKFGDLMPMPYEKEALFNAVKAVKDKLNNNGKNGKRIVKDKYDDLLKSYINGASLLELEDLKSIVTSLEGDPIKTHKDFEDTKNDLESKLNTITEEDYRPIDLSLLKEEYNKSISIEPKEHYGFTEDSRRDFYDTLEEVRGTIAVENIYLTEDDTSKLINKLEEKRNALKEEKLDSTNKVRISIKYTRPMKDAISPLLKEYFKDDNGEPITIIKEVTLGQEVRIPLSSELIKKFDGYRPVSFHYNSDDGTLKLVRVFTDEKGKSFAVFKAISTNENNLATLDIHYEEGKLPEEFIDYSKNLLEMNLSDAGISLKGKLSKDAKLNVEALDEKGLPEALKNEITKLDNKKVLGAYEISLSGNHEGSLELTFSLDNEGKDVKILHLKDDMTIESFERTVKDGKVVINVNSLSPFVVLGEKSASIAEKKDSNTSNKSDNLDNKINKSDAKASSPKTGDHNQIIMIYIALVLIATSSLGFINTKQK